MKKIIAINASPRRGWNTFELVRSAADGAESAGAEIRFIDLYKLDKFTGCVSCFGCKSNANLGKCIYADALAPILEEIRSADGLIIGTPNYLGEATAAFRALYERLIFQYLSYKTEPRNYNERHIPVLFIMTSNVPEERYAAAGYDHIVEKYKNMLSRIIGPTQVLICGDTLQVKDYSPYDWTMFDPDAKLERHEKEFPLKKQEAFRLGAEMI